MKVAAYYSHLNGEEFLRFRHPKLWEEIHAVIDSVDADSCRTKESKEKTKEGRLLFSPVDMNQRFKAELGKRSWKERRAEFWVTKDEQVVRGIIGLPPNEQKQRITEAGLEPIYSYNQSDFVKEPVYDPTYHRFGHRNSAHEVSRKGDVFRRSLLRARPNERLAAGTRRSRCAAYSLRC